LAQRKANKPQILDANPELEEAIRYVSSDPEPSIEDEDQQRLWMETINRAHPGIFSTDIDPELEQAILKRRESGEADWSDPLVAIAEITAEKLAYTERQTAKKYEAQAAKNAQKSAMSVPGAGSSAVNVQPVDKQAEAVNRIRNMSEADFEKERRRVLGL
jgi:hypothetical protein